MRMYDVTFKGNVRGNIRNRLGFSASGMGVA